MYTDEAERWKSYGRCHVAYLAVLAFDERELDPTGGNVCAETYWRVALPNPIRCFDDFSLAGLGMVAFYVNAFSELTGGFFGDLSIDLCEVCARMLVFRVEQFFYKFSVVC